MLEDYRTAPIDEKLRATLGLLEIFTRTPEQLTASRVREVIDAGVAPAAIRDAFYAAFVFNTLDRLADTLGWEVPDRRYFERAGKILLRRGYG